MKEPRAYQDEHDLQAMGNILVAGRKAENGSYYVHRGDLKWWMYYPPLEGAFWEHIHLWDDPAHPGQLLGWALISPDWVGFDVYVRPELRGSTSAREMYLWAEEQARRIASEKGKPTINVMWVRPDDQVLTGHLESQGFRLHRGTVQLAMSLEGLHLQAIPVGDFAIRSCRGEPEVGGRAHAQHAAFNSEAPFERYLDRFTRFMRSPAYNHDRDIVAGSADGQIGAFCIIWLDTENKVGLFEPVGTHPDFQRRGLGRAVMVEGLRRLQDFGMDQAIVSTGEDNLPAIKFYEALGFEVINHFGTYKKDV